MSSNIKKFSVNVGGHQTSMSLEAYFYDKLVEIAKAQDRSIDQIVTEVDQSRDADNLSSHVREYILRHYVGDKRTV